MDKILVVEDDPAIARMFQRILKLGGRYEVAHATNGKLGLDLARSLKPDLILLDIMMPEMNGLDVLDALRADDELGQIPVLVLTNLAGDQNVSIAVEKGAVGYMVKSDSDPSDLLAAVQGILGALRDEHYSK